MLSRRSLLTTGIALLAAPAIVRATSLMPVKVWKVIPDRTDEWDFGANRTINAVHPDHYHPAMLGYTIEPAASSDNLMIRELWDARHPELPFWLWRAPSVATVSRDKVVSVDDFVAAGGRIIAADFDIGFKSVRLIRT